MSISSEEADLAESNENKRFQLKENTQFNRKDSGKRRLKRHNMPSYRLIHVYSKSIRQYKNERARRRQVLKLLQEDRSMGEIAETLGVCTRTVQRDMNKLGTYLKGQVNRKRYLLDQERQRELDSLSTLSLLERFKILTRLLGHTRKLSKREQFDMHNKTLIVNMDELHNGYPTFTLEGCSTARFLTPFKFTVIGKKGTEQCFLGEIRIG